MPRQIKHIFIHHSKTKDGQTVSWDDIERYHVYTRGWIDNGYTAGAENVDGQIICMFGRPDWLSGAHTRGHNRDSLGFCFVGDFDTDIPSEQLLRTACYRVLAPWLARHGLGVDALRGHNEVSSKTCPGTKFNMHRLREICQEELDEISG